MTRAAPKTELDLVPIMNMVTILIPFLLMSAAFTTVAVVDVDARPAGKETAGEVEERPTVVITRQGFVFTATDGGTETLPCDTGCREPTDYDLEGLRHQLSLHKDRVPEGDAVELIAGDDVSYDVLIAVMDASRRDGVRDLYPQVLFGSLPVGG